jgi:hypothetical protein
LIEECDLGSYLVSQFLGRPTCESSNLGAGGGLESLAVMQEWAATTVVRLDQPLVLGSHGESVISEVWGAGGQQ